MFSLVAASLAACGSENSGSVALGTTPTTTTTVTAPVASTTAPPPTTGAPPRPTTTAPEPPPSDLSGFRTESFRIEHFLTVPPVPVLTAVRVAHHPGFDRVVFDFDNQLPGAVSVRYVDRVVSDGSGEPVAVMGTAFLQVRYEESQAHTDAGAPTVARRIAATGLTTVREIVLAGDYEGYVTVALGLTGRAAFRVIELRNPSRVVVDVRSLT